MQNLQRVEAGLERPLVGLSAEKIKGAGAESGVFPPRSEPTARLTDLCRLNAQHNRFHVPAGERRAHHVVAAQAVTR